MRAQGLAMVGGPEVRVPTELGSRLDLVLRTVHVDLLRRLVDADHQTGRQQDLSGEDPHAGVDDQIGVGDHVGVLVDLPMLPSSASTP